MNRSTQYTGSTFLIAAALLATPTARGQQLTAGRKYFADSVAPLPATIGLAPQGLVVQSVDSHKNDRMDLLFSLAIPKEAQEKLEERVAKGQVISPEELRRDYSPKEADVTRLVTWLKDQKFEVNPVSADRTSVYARAAVAQIEKSLQVRIVRVTREGFTYNAAAAPTKGAADLPGAPKPPSLPADVGASVQAITGLQPFRRAHKNARMLPPRGGNRASRRPAAGFAVSAAHNEVANTPPYLVREVLRAYDAEGLGLTGTGQKIAILIDTFPKDDDLTAFWSRNGLGDGAGRVEKVNVKGGELPVPEGEETLDVEWATGVAPGATVRVYASGSLAFVDIDMALDRILDDRQGEPGMSQLSISLGLGEKYLGGPGGEMAVQHQKFVRLAAMGVNVFVSSGDSGSRPDQTGHDSTGEEQVEYEASDSFVISVGGTTLTLGHEGSVANETGWSGSGGGLSRFFTRPSWQRGVGMPAGDKRCVPDVSLAADPDTGALILFQGQVVQIGGTSWSAPVWAGFCAIMNEARSRANKPSLPFLAPRIYPLLGTPCFRDVVAGTNGDFHAGPGYDLVTGVGVPNVRKLTQEIVK